MKAVTILLLALLVPISPVRAETNTPTIAAPKALGRLFFTPEQRARMDVARQNERDVRIEETPEDAVAPPANLTLNGVITRSDGQTTLWINSKVQSGENLGLDITVPRRGERAGQIRVVTPETKQSVPLKVGQSIDMNSGQVEDGYLSLPAPPVENGQSIAP